MSKIYFLAVRSMVFQFKNGKARDALLRKLDKLGLETATAESNEAKK